MCKSDAQIAAIVSILGKKKNQKKIYLYQKASETKQSVYPASKLTT